tara:strand:- start:284 stop:727 length:444 start_codon:yes stop_codon:yes gene_type:complete
MPLPLLAIGVSTGARRNTHFELELELQGQTLSLTEGAHVDDIRLAVLRCKNDVTSIVNRVPGLVSVNGRWENVSTDQLNSILEELKQVLVNEQRPSVTTYSNAPRAACNGVPVPYIMASVNRKGDKITVGYELNMAEFKQNLECIRS